MFTPPHTSALAPPDHPAVWCPCVMQVDDEFEQDIMEDVEAECSKFGAVVKVHVDR